MKISDVTSLLKKWRENNERNSLGVIELWDDVLEKNIGRAGNETIKIIDQVIIAAYDCDRLKIASSCLKELSAKFTNSFRVEKFKAIEHEVLENYEDSFRILNDALQKDDTNSALRKRKIALLKAKGHRTNMIQELCDYLQKFMSDQEAWHQLCFLFIEERAYEKALFCTEELILHNPFNHLMYQRLADIRYTMGGAENVDMAKWYYLHAVKLNPSNIRGLYGALMCCLQIINSKLSYSKKKDALILGRWIFQCIEDKIGKVGSGYTPKKYLKSFKLAISEAEIRK